MQMCQVDVVRLEIAYQVGGRLGKIPPASPVARADQPWVRDYADAVVIHAKAGVAQNSEFQNASSEASEHTPSLRKLNRRNKDNEIGSR